MLHALAVDPAATHLLRQTTRGRSVYSDPPLRDDPGWATGRGIRLGAGEFLAQARERDVLGWLVTKAAIWTGAHNEGNTGRAYMSYANQYWTRSPGRANDAARTCWEHGTYDLLDEKA